MPELPKLPEAELDVMAALWRQGPSTARRVRESLAGTRPMAHASVMTLLNRLEGKGLVARAKGERGKAFIYRALRQPQSAGRGLVRDLARRLFGGSAAMMVASLFDGRKPTDDELRQLDQLLRDLKERSRK